MLGLPIIVDMDSSVDARRKKGRLTSFLHAGEDVFCCDCVPAAMKCGRTQELGTTLELAGMKIFRFLPEFRFEHSESWVLNSKKSFRPAASNIGLRPMFRFPNSSPFSCLI